MLTNCRVVLVRTHYAGNIGSAARAMKNFGLTDLVLVDPIANVTDHQARMLATNGGDILDVARVVPDFYAAVADCGYVLGSSGETAGTLRRTLVGTPRELLPKFVQTLASTRCALVFGPEPHGLANEELARCHALLVLPTAAEFTSLNLALAVGITLYELHQFYREGTTTPPEAATRPPAAYADFDRAMAHLHDALTDVRFLFGQNGEALMHAFRHMVGRALPTQQEVKLLHGLARQMEYAADQMKKAETQMRGPK
ncbi:RNA methyltransferase [Limnoglobus roseus]|uniref:tRNA (cytidine/uridine-2'-O-)-methyltransferase TrmJ n=1 Tax=Limnoglobus roseus TaxID=2598579 RepID=A0A5C1ALZ3_9BACT|nr:RNA methyltransferase [Limnoglobus roseus]QEL18194.1 RNA methyltransferase [Limnoglobus roseus]